MLLPDAHLDEVDFWPISSAVANLTAAEQDQLVALRERAVRLSAHPRSYVGADFKIAA